MIKSPEIKALEKLFWGKIRVEQKKGPQRVKTEVYERTNGKCEWPRCKKHMKRSEGEFHHWRDTPRKSTTAFLCHSHHRDKKYKTHTYKVETDILGNKKVRVVRRKRIPITKKRNPTKRQPKKKPTKRRRPKTPLERLTKQLEEDFLGS